ncbi:hypothetical protein [Bacillus rhizoplanae]|uniref:hypothetical protein n=1 Tax=Bacillus rhizoplanae TaxID=2880966 RepID=UPI003D207EDB
MKSIKRFIQVILVSTSILILSGCFSKDDLNQPIQEYLKTNYGIQDEFSVIQTDNNWFEGIDHQTYIEIKKPYRAYPFLMIERDTLKILKDDSDDIYLEQFKGAYIEQHPEVVQVIKQIIKKYGLVKYPNKVVPEEDSPIYMFPYDNIELNIINSQELLNDFKKTQKIDTIDLLPKLKPSDPRRENYNSRYLGVVNFLFKFDMNKNKHPIPKAKDLIVEFQKSGVLTKGIYNIDMLVADSNPDHYLGWEYNNVALFEVDENGKYTIIATPKYDDLDNSYFYGDYEAKKIKE